MGKKSQKTRTTPIWLEFFRKAAMLAPATAAFSIFQMIVNVSEKFRGFREPLGDALAWLFRRASSLKTRFKRTRESLQKTPKILRKFLRHAKLFQVHDALDGNFAASRRLSRGA
jgi:hypothetical protein